MEGRGLAGIVKEEKDLHQSGMVHPSPFRFPGLGFLESEEKEIADSSKSADRANRFELCIGFLGQSPTIVKLKKPPQKGLLVLALPAPKKFAVLALQAGGELEIEGQQAEKNLKPRWRGRARRELSPLSAALHRANKQMPEM
jgi:hypothetical protein